MDLYATESQAFRRITFPLVFPGILGAALLSFSLSFDDFIITNLNAGNTTTFPMYVWGVAQRGVPMQVNVVGTLMFVIAIAIVVASRSTGGGRRRRWCDQPSTDGVTASLRTTSPAAYWLEDPAQPPPLAALEGPDSADLSSWAVATSGSGPRCSPRSGTPNVTSCCWRPRRAGTLRADATEASARRA